ncbi:Two component regulator propeller [Roseateles sp. YR242]|uniref:sensor histidine kinase n=1 Tax=Roseateles sp. YR242 TaxID=1855305 RepID=UPI0008CF4CE1|nr:sensor histidine kinase [Roseateles sp. YR242]SEK34938.1 Two component regulator propeller [Roseateles sp. YR242]
MPCTSLPSSPAASAHTSRWQRVCSWAYRNALDATAHCIRVFLAAMLSCTAAWALPPSYTVSQLYHTRWTAHDGVPPGIEAIAQTPDGFLWLGSMAGLFRFDGVMFERFAGAHGTPLLSQDVYALHVSGDGGLWVGYHFGGVSHLLNGQLVNYGPAQGLPRSSVSSLANAGDGTLWAGTTRGMFRLEGARWTQGTTSWNLPQTPVDALVLDRDGTLWMMGDDHIHYLRKGAARFEKLAVTVPGSNYHSLLLQPDGTAMVCMSGRMRTLALTPPDSAGLPAPEWKDLGITTDIDSRHAFDREGHLWFGGAKGAGRLLPAWGAAPVTRSKLRSNDRGTVHDERDAITDRAPLTGESISRIFEDREGNMWFTTRSGLDRFRAPASLRLPSDPGSLEFSLAPAADHSVWIGSSRGNIFRARRATQKRVKFDHLSSAGIDVLYSAPSGTLWAAGADALWRHSSDQDWLHLPRQPGHQPASFTYSSIQAMTQDASGAMWVSVLRTGVYRVMDGQWTLWGGRTDMPSQNATALFTDARGRVWFGYDDGEVTVLDGDHLRRVVVTGGVPLPVARLTEGTGTVEAAAGAVGTFAEGGDHLWMGSENGLWRLDGESFHPVVGAHGPFTGVNGIVPCLEGDLWISSNEGVVHLPADALKRSLASPGQPVEFELLNHLDGLPGIPVAAVGTDDGIWFATVNGVVWIDPLHRPRNTIVPQVMVKAIIADGKTYPVDPGTIPQLPSHTRDLKITFTAPSLTMPERVNFRFRLGDEQAAWQDVGTHREAYFRDLPPGQHQFQVVAANNDGLWSPTGASVAFVIPPTFVQTPWFKALCALAVAAALGLLYLLKIRAIKSRLRLRLEERMVERERIARELHDTLLQATQGLVLRFHAAMEQIPRHERSRALMEDALEYADEVIADGRDAVTNLRGTSDPSMDFAKDLQLIGERWSRDTGIAFAMSMDGPVCPLEPVAVQECLRIIAEAMGNAFRHARATRVNLTLAYSPRGLSLQVSDNGSGFNPDNIHVGRWGLIGMQERAARLTARLHVQSDERGTVLTLDVPARIVYRRGQRRWGHPLAQLRRRHASQD